MKNNNPILESAMWLASRGIYVNAVQPNSKALVNTGPVMDGATCDPVVIADLFGNHPEYNLGVVPGPKSDLLILDQDVKNGARGHEALAALVKHCGHPLPKTLTERTPSTGNHYYYKHDERLRNGKLLIDGIRGIEVMATPYNVVVAPSIIDGKSYEWTERCEIVTLSDDVIEFLLSCYEKHDRSAPVVERNNSMFAEACRMRRYNVPEAEAWNKLLTFNEVRCVPPLGEPELKKLFRSAWKYEPGYFATDLGNRDRFRDQHGENSRFVYESKRWLHWDETRFVEDHMRRAEQLMADVVRKMHLDAVDMPAGTKDEEAVRAAALKWANISERKERVHGALALVPGPDNIVSQTALDADPWLLSVPNAILDLRTGKPTRADQSQLITKVARMTYEPDATCPLWVAFLERVLPDSEARWFLQRFAGYSLTGLTTEQCMLLIFGDTHCGKTTALQTLEYAWGDYAKKTPASTWLAKGKDAIPNDVAALAGARLVVSTESEKGARWATSLLKAATGEETLSARFMYGEFFSFLPQFKIAFGTNFLPDYDGGDRALTRRLLPLRFGVEIPDTERDQELQHKLRDELPGILNWALAGCLLWQRDGLNAPATIKTEKDGYAESNNHLAAFIEECCECEADYSEAAGPLHKAYTAWCADHHVPGHRPGAFKEALLKRGFKHKKAANSNRYHGLKLVPHGY
jgi:putative DNA primase/helicase